MALGLSSKTQVWNLSPGLDKAALDVVDVPSGASEQKVHSSKIPFKQEGNPRNTS